VGPAVSDQPRSEPARPPRGQFSAWSRPTVLATVAGLFAIAAGGGVMLFLWLAQLDPTDPTAAPLGPVGETGRSMAEPMSSEPTIETAIPAAPEQEDKSIVASLTVKERTDLDRIFAISDLQKRFDSMLPSYILWAEQFLIPDEIPMTDRLRHLLTTEFAQKKRTPEGQQITVQVIVYVPSEDKLIDFLSTFIRNRDGGTREIYDVFLKKGVFDFDFDRLAYLFAKYVVLEKLPKARVQ
jgi:hypothetical protein